VSAEPTKFAREVVIAYHFTAGRYHATPWGSHVNEGAIEWPPSPFRILRALIATGFARLGWEPAHGIPRELFAILGSTLPSYVLPSGSASHTRHYMPLKDKPTKVIDAFLRFPRDSTLLVRFPVALPDTCRVLLKEIVRRQPYLGRAEAWVEAELLDGEMPEGLDWIEPGVQSPGPGFERVELLALETEAAFCEWRTGFITRQVREKEREEKQKVELKGKTFKALGKTEMATIEASVPPKAVDSLLLETGLLRKEGWSQPPGTRWVAYFRQAQATAPRHAHGITRSPSQLVTAALLALSSDTKNADVFPPRCDALRRLESLHSALVSLSKNTMGIPSRCFTGQSGQIEGESGTQHQHASLYPLTIGRREDRMDHVLVHCPMGFDDDARRALFELRKTYAKDLPTLYVTLAGLGSIDAFSTELALVRSAQVFTSVTPFVPARFLKRKGQDALLGQVLRELAQRGLPVPVRVEVKTSDKALAYVPASASVIGHRASDFALLEGEHTYAPCNELRKYVRARPSRPPPMNLGLSLRLEFDVEVRGPIAIGYGSHFGLGLLAPKVTV
jgi:CRISPR-associated protein Csb2